MENINEQFKRLFCELDLTDDQAAMIKKLQRDVYAALRQPPVSGSVLEQIRQAFADYYKSEGCSCCRDESKHNEAEKRLAELLKPDMYEDGSGFNWNLYASTDR